MKPTLLIVDDDEEIRSQLRWALTGEYDVVQPARNRTEALAIFRDKRPAVVLLDLGLPPSPAAQVEGLTALSEIITEERLAKVVIVSGQGERANAMQAIGQGAWDLVETGRHGGTPGHSPPRLSRRPARAGLPGHAAGVP